MQLVTMQRATALRMSECLHPAAELSFLLPLCSAHYDDILQLAVRCKVEALSFSAHADYEQTSGFLDTLQPPHVVLVHGERGEMMKLRAVSQHRPVASDRRGQPYHGGLHVQTLLAGRVGPLASLAVF
jgi:hypothetical protein